MAGVVGPFTDQYDKLKTTINISKTSTVMAKKAAFSVERVNKLVC
jgi:hypothetical protein